MSVDKQPPYNYGDVVTITAIGNSGWAFTEWKQACSGQGNPCVLTITGTLNVKAVFSEVD